MLKLSKEDIINLLPHREPMLLIDELSEIDKVFQTISPIINSYMEQKSVKILFDAKNIFMARNDLNLTNDILEAINKETK